MALFSSLISLATVLLGYLSQKLQDKYNSELKELREQYEIEINKPDEVFNDARVDALERQLCIVADAIANQARLKNA